MTLMTRISRLFRADMHAVLDSLEEPAALLHDAIREMDELLAQDERRLHKLERQQAELAAAAAECAAFDQRSEGELALCFEAGKDELARTLVRRRLENEQRLSLIARRTEAARAAATETHTRLAAQRQRLGELRQLAAVSDAAQLREDAAQGAQAWDTFAPITDAAVEIAFLREKQMRSPS